jgi:serine/threonine protein kinase
MGWKNIEFFFLIIDFVTGEQDEYILSNNSIQPEWRSNYRGDYKGTTNPVCTHDLLCWAFQVARGMDYLASRKVRLTDMTWHLPHRSLKLSDGEAFLVS